MIDTRRTRSRSGGFVLICVLWILAILTVITLGFGRRALLDQRAAAFSIDEMQAVCLARGAAVQGLVELEQRRRVQESVGGWLRSRADAYSADNGPIPEAMDVLGTGDVRETFPGLFDVPFENEECGYRIEDEERRLCVNHITREVLDAIEAVDPRTRSAILDRLRDSQTSAVPAFSVLEEFLTLDGVDDRTWRGERGRAGLRDLLTVYGDGRVNINTASEDVLTCLPGLGEDAVRDLLIYRAGADGELDTADDRRFGNLEEIPHLTGIDPAALAPLSLYGKTDSRFFKISGFATRRQRRIRAVCAVSCVMLDDRIAVLRWEEDTGGS